MKETVVVGMSGGVDSSVAAYLLKEQGRILTTVITSLKNWCSLNNPVSTNSPCATVRYASPPPNDINTDNAPFFV